ncbi:unnamed protein product [Strongylus vulgaris]|uniref:Uncharacterized protein n=1 Tax=Strongylus vulgaris TaxID=40348 RepID=A0A3P7IMG3_STRVU|nr:unnamed protein product [Strongylus vulgaris]
MKDLSQKYNTSVSQLTKKADIAEKEKNDAVIKYATREAEMMRMRAEVQKKEQELQECRKVKEELEQCQSQENVEQLEKSNNTLRVEVEHIKHEKFDLENRLKIAEKRAEPVCLVRVVIEALRAPFIGYLFVGKHEILQTSALCSMKEIAYV